MIFTFCVSKSINWAWRRSWLKVQCFYLFASSTGQPLVNNDGETSNFDSQWQRAMFKAIKETDLTERFQERDLRAKVASDVDTAEEAAQLLQHHSTATTKKVYRRKPETVLPIKR
jgi:integrase